ncbi:TNF receptor-associated factor 5-like [Lytechinus variegatus]|uniref:TNF receptor-associated factor 5-like n=1 Tax=Lytechinus variegatus TaxID=7654 RepID=UPI001BB1536B|nr:TNF receptor-associated factor 5-like [Lytechinus variegatus]
MPEPEEEYYEDDEEYEDDDDEEEEEEEEEEEGSRHGSGKSSGSGRGKKKKNGITMGDMEVVFTEEVNKKYICTVCQQILRYPVQFEECGHRCCSSCLPELLRVSPRCPLDQSPVARDKVYVDTAFGNEIGELSVKCPNYDKGCPWTGVLKENKDHFAKCMYVEVECPNVCGAHFDKRFLETHLEDDCTKRMVQCEFCQKKIFFKDEIAHMNACQNFPVPCPNGCKLTEIPRGEVKAHVDKDCPKSKIPCPFSDFGCPYKCERQRMQKHINDEPTEHLTFVGNTMLKNNEQLQKHNELLMEHKDSLGVCMQKVRDLEKLYGSQLVWKIDKYAERMQEAKQGKKVTIFSPPFLTSRHGYRLSVSCCLNGDGKAKSHFMSIFVCINRGEYDALLPWPFSHRITFTLIDQCQDPTARRNISYNIKPNPCKENKAFLGRPLGERNASFGTQKFVPLNMIKTLDYIRDDTMFIKVQVDYDNMILL